MTFSEHLYKAMATHGLSQAEVCRRTGCSKAAVSQYLSSKMTPPVGKQREIAAALGLREDYFQSTEPEAPVRISNMLPEEAGRILGIGKAVVRKGLQDGVFPWGYAVQMESGRWVYFINRERFYEIEGIQKGA